MPRNGPVFQDHHAIEQQTRQHGPQLKALADAGHFNISPAKNRMFLRPVGGGMCPGTEGKLPQHAVTSPTRMG